MGLSELLSALEAQASETARTLLEAARAESARIEAEAVEGLARRTHGGLEKEEARLRAGAASAIADARREQRRRVLEKRELLLDRVFARALALMASETSAPAEHLAVEIRQALRYLGGIPAVILCAPAVAVPVRALLADLEGVTVTPDPALPSGFVARAADASVVVDRTPARRLAALRPTLAIELMRRIEPPA